MINGKNFISGRVLDTLSLTGYREFSGISGGIAVIAHEARHVDGFPHVSCCPAGAGACDHGPNARQHGDNRCRLGLGELLAQSQ